jgi:DNA-binding beta-propeller fold protein YncE
MAPSPTPSRRGKNGAEHSHTDPDDLTACCAHRGGCGLPGTATGEVCPRGLPSFAGREGSKGVGVRGQALCRVAERFGRGGLPGPGGSALGDLPYRLCANWSNNVVYSGDGRVGFVASYSNNRLFSFDTTTGEMLGEVVVCCGPGGITLHERPEKRVVLVKNFDTDDVAIVDATDPRAMRIQARFTPPAGTDFYYAIGRPAISSDGRIGFIGSERGTDKLYIFDVETGELLSSVTVSGRSPITWSLVPGKPWIAVVVDEGGYITMVNATNPRSPSIVWSRSYTFDGWSDFGGQ